MHRSLCHHLEAPLRRCHAWAATSRSGARGEQRGLTLIELLVTIALIAVVTSGVVMGSGAVGGARLRGAASMINGAVRIAFTRASATSKANRLVFDLEKSMVILEETSQTVLVRKEAAAGSQGVTAEERAAQEETSRILKGPQIQRPLFTPVKALGFDDPDTSGGRALGKGVKFRRVETGHMPDGQTSGRAYLHFWPGGRTERAAIQLMISGNSVTDGITLMVSPLTGKVRTVAGAQSMEPLRDDGTSSEREDRSF